MRCGEEDLVGTKLGKDKAGEAAHLIKQLEPFVSGTRAAGLDEIWTFFDMKKPRGKNFSEGDATAKTLHGKMNRQRLLLHPDKNSHPKAEQTFKFLEQCHQRLVQSYTRSRESKEEKAQREEEETRKAVEKKRKEEADGQARLEKIRREEEAKHRREEQKAQKAESRYDLRAASERLTPDPYNTSELEEESDPELSGWEVIERPSKKEMFAYRVQQVTGQFEVNDRARLENATHCAVYGLVVGSVSWGLGPLGSAGVAAGFAAAGYANCPTRRDTEDQRRR